MNDIAVIIVGIDGWDKWTKPAIKSFSTHEFISPAEIIVIDNGSNPSYPNNDFVIRIDKTVSYTKAINKGIEKVGKRDWYLILNNDIRFDAPVTPIIDKLDNSFIYGKQIIEGNGYRWLGLWLALIPYPVFERVGKFDENFKVCGFDDADYCVRAKNLGIDTLHVDLPIHHYGSKTIINIKEYVQCRKDNIDYFEKKHGWRPEPYKVIHE